MNLALKFVKQVSVAVLFPLLVCHARAGDSFTNSLAQASMAEKRGDVQTAVQIYEAAQQSQGSNATNLCVLSHCYCDLTWLTNSPDVQKELVTRALTCAQQAVTADPKNATAHASVAVCLAKSCTFADIKTQLADSRMFKLEAEKAIALDPKQDVAYYVLGRWNYGIAGVGMFSRAYVKVIYGSLPKASYQDAITNFQKAVALAPNRILNHAGLAMAYEAVGDKQDEIIELKKCCALKPLGPEDADAGRDAGKKLAALGP